jgi:hypothetical protein
MMKRFIFVFLLGTLLFSCQKKEQSEILPHQTIVFSVGPDFSIGMPGALPETIRNISLNGEFLPVAKGTHVALLLKHKGSETDDTLYVQSACSIDNLDVDYFRFSNGKNVLNGRILIDQGGTWRICNEGELTFSGELSFIYNPD